MTSAPENLLIIMSDEHSRHVLGCCGNALVQTPNLDALAARGTVFPHAYTPSPICVPARAAFATGSYVHQTGHWDNAFPYCGEPSSWGHRLQQEGFGVTSIGKLHYRNAEDPTGFDVQELPLHVVNGVGDVLGAVREPLPVRFKARDLAENIGPGETGYTRYDIAIRDVAVNWLKQMADSGQSTKPWACFVSMVAPHFPLVAPPHYYRIYENSGVMPVKPVPVRDHPWFEAFRKCFPYDNFDGEKTRVALASYYGLVSFVDANIGSILSCLDHTGLARNTRVLYVSDHGENAGERGLWGKSNFFEESVGIPAILAGPDIPKGRVSETPVNLTDIYPTVMDAFGLESEETNLRGQSLIEIANAENDTERIIFSEYHAAGATSGAFMIRKGRYKYVHYVGLPPQLFDLATDPDELTDLGADPTTATVRETLHAALMAICEPDAVDAQAKSDQAALVEAHGGRDAVVSRGGFGATPPPGEEPQFEEVRS